MTSSINEAYFFEFSQEEHNKKMKEYREKNNNKDTQEYINRIILTPCATISIINHGVKGGRQEIIGLPIGLPHGQDIYAQDVFSSPELGTETNVKVSTNVWKQFNTYREACNEIGLKNTNMCGWYHSHPDYGCFLSQTDVDASVNMQLYAPISVSLVVDPIKTSTYQRIFLGAFRTYNFKVHTPKANNVTSNSFVSSEKAKDFEYTQGKYYNLAIEYYITNTDRKIMSDIIALTWGNTLGESLLDSNALWVQNKIIDSIQPGLMRVLAKQFTEYEINDFKREIDDVNFARIAGIEIEKMKLHVFL